jgi:hypothetical protein
MIELYGLMDPKKLRDAGKGGVFIRGKSEGEVKK